MQSLNRTNKNKISLKSMVSSPYILPALFVLISFLAFIASTFAIGYIEPPQKTYLSYMEASVCQTNGAPELLQNYFRNCIFRKTVNKGVLTISFNGIDHIMENSSHGYWHDILFIEPYEISHSECDVLFWRSTYNRKYDTWKIDVTVDCN